MIGFERELRHAGAIVSISLALAASSMVSANADDHSAAAPSSDLGSRIRWIEARARTQEYFESAAAARGLFKDENTLDKSKLSGAEAEAVADVFSAVRALVPAGETTNLFAGDSKATASEVHKKLLPLAARLDELNATTNGAAFFHAATKSVANQLHYVLVQLELITSERKPDTERAAGVRRECTRNLLMLERLTLFFAGSDEFRR